MSISVIVLKYRENFFNKVKASIGHTIGIPYELIEIDNTRGQFSSIADAYNTGVGLSRFPFICFVHEDVDFITEGWGKKLVSVMNNDQQIGLIGLVGSKFKSYQPTSFTNTIKNSFFIRGGLGIQKIGSLSGEEEVVCVDGVFLFARKEVFKQCSFDPVLIKGFHGYDMDFSLQVHFSGYKVVVSGSAAIKHFSAGNRNMEWLLTNKAISRKWSEQLPVASRDLNYSRAELWRLEWETIAWLAGKNKLKNLVKVPLFFLRFLLRRRH